MRPSLFRRAYRRLPHVLRVSGFAIFAAAIATVASLRSARAHLHEGMQQLARQLMPYAQEATMESPRRVDLNGESMYLAMGTSHDSPEAVLDWYEARCAHVSGQLTRAVRAASQSAASLDGAAFNQLWTASPGRRTRSLETVRSGDDREGYVACVDTGAVSLSPTDIIRRIRAVVDTGDLGQLGGLRYVYAQRGISGTRILTVATEGHFNLFRMFPTQGDAPGSEAVALPRFPGMRRVLSAHEDGTPYGLAMYSVHAPVSDVRGYYTRTMPTQGWDAIEVPRGRPLPPEFERERGHMAAFHHGDETLLLVFDSRDGVTSMMSLAGT